MRLIVAAVALLAIPTGMTGCFYRPHDGGYHRHGYEREHNRDRDRDRDHRD